MDENKIDINSLIGFFLIGLIFIGWLYLNPPPPTPENIQSDNVILMDAFDNKLVFRNQKENIPKKL